MIIAELPKANSVFRPGQTHFTGASFWEYSGVHGWRCVWSGELGSEESLKEMTSGWKIIDKEWKPGLVFVSNHITGETCRIEPSALLS